MGFSTKAKVRFADVDPAGIVFYPRYLEMLNAAVEDWFAGDLGQDFRMLHMDMRIGVPTVKLAVTFLSPSELGDVIDIAITLRQVGRSSCAIAIEMSGAGRARLCADVTLVCMNLDSKRAVPWPSAIRERMLAGMIAE